jgi:non-lysosomal glucosylceramidase
MPTKRRTFLKQVTLASAATQVAAQSSALAGTTPTSLDIPEIAFPRVFTGRRLTAIAFPLGGVCAGCISLGGRGQLRDWEIFNRPDKGNAPSYAFPAIWARAGKRKPVARVLESRIQPPFEGSSGLGSRNAPGLTRLDSATFTGEFPLARVQFAESTLPVKVSLEAFSPFIPHDPTSPAAGGHPAISRHQSRPGVGRSLHRLVHRESHRPHQAADTRVNEYRTSERLAGILMTSPELPGNDALKGSFVLSVLDSPAPGHPPARMGARPLVELADVFLGRFLRRWRTRSRVERPRTGGGALARPHHRARSPCRLHVPAGLAFPQSYAAPLRVECRERR